MARLFLSLADDEVKRFDSAREKAGMTRSQYLKFLLSGRRDFRPPVLRYRELISVLSDIERDIKIVAMKEDISDTDRLLMMTKLDDVKEILQGRFKEAGHGSK